LRLSFTADEPVKLMIDRLKELLCRKFPAGRLEDVLAEAIAAYLDDHDPRRREPAQRRETRNADGRRCGETKWLELDHAIPWALGGRSDDAGNIRILCRTHNQWEAQTLFGFRKRR
jgi:hypothetical protein